MPITADKVITPVKQYVASFLEELGSTSDAQNTYLFNYISLTLWKLAHIAYQPKYSDVLNITADGYQTFKLSAVDITDFYAPLRILNASGQEVQWRTSYSAPTGWYKESASVRIHTKNLTGNHTLHYLDYPAEVTATTSVIDFPKAGLMGLIYYVSAGVLESLPNAKELSDHFYRLAEKDLKIAVLANTDARGKSSGGFVPSPFTVDQFFKG